MCSSSSTSRAHLNACCPACASLDHPAFWLVGLNSSLLKRCWPTGTIYCEGPKSCRLWPPNWARQDPGTGWLGTALSCWFAGFVGSFSAGACGR